MFTRNIFDPAHSQEGDRGGNRTSFGPGKNDNLHSLWDDAPGRKSDFHIVVARAETLLDDTDLVSKGQAAVSNADPLAWAKESFELAKQQVYRKSMQTQILVADATGADPDNDEIVDLPANYVDEAAKLASQRVVEGGFRLAAKLKASIP